MKIVIKDPMEHFGNFQVSLEGRYTDEQIIKLIEDVLLKTNRGIIADISVEKSRFKVMDYFKSAQEWLE